jgi:hypothetical protein
MISCGFDILETGTCSYIPTDLHELTYTRTSTFMPAFGNLRSLILGGFVPGEGIAVCYATDRKDTGAIPMIPAEGCSYSLFPHVFEFNYWVFLAKYTFSYCRAER